MASGRANGESPLCLATNTEDPDFSSHVRCCQNWHRLAHPGQNFNTPSHPGFVPGPGPLARPANS